MSKLYAAKHNPQTRTIHLRKQRQRQREERTSSRMQQYRTMAGLAKNVANTIQTPK